MGSSPPAGVIEAITTRDPKTGSADWSRGSVLIGRSKSVRRGGLLPELVTCDKVDEPIYFVMSNRLRRLESFAEAAKVRTSDLFVKLHMDKITGTMLMRDPDLKPRDVAILLALAGEMDPQTGRINLAVSELARKCGTRQSTVALSISRLKKKLLVINRQDRDSKAYYMLINPDLVSQGAPSQRSIKYRQFLDEWVNAMQDEFNGDRARALQVMEKLVDENYATRHQQELEDARREEELARLVCEADPKLQAFLAERKVFKPMSDSALERAKVKAT